MSHWKDKVSHNMLNLDPYIFMNVVFLPLYFQKCRVLSLYFPVILSFDRNILICSRAYY